TGVKSIYIGGDTDVANKDLEKWDKSLEDYTKWKIVEFRDVVSIFEILDSNLRRRVLGILGERIVYAKVDQRNLTFSNQKPYIHELDVPEKYKGKLDDYKIFASIISEKKGTFFVRVVYKVDSADLLIHQFGKDSRLEYSLKIVWIIIGIPNDFNLFDLKDFNMSELEIKLSGQVSSNKLQEIHDLYDKYDGDTYPIVTCALKDSERDLHDLKIVTGIHFYRTNDNHLNMCVHNYDLENKREIIEKNLSVQYCIVHCGHDFVAQGTLDNSFIKGGKKRKKTTWKCNQPAFTSLFHTSCISGGLKITPDNAVFKSFRDGISFDKNEVPALHYI
ncbi:13835_t:CDS:2, partial [Ambispora leptoticha]